jgi:hypothetical protein
MMEEVVASAKTTLTKSEIQVNTNVTAQQNNIMLLTMLKENSIAEMMPELHVYNQRTLHQCILLTIITRDNLPRTMVNAHAQVVKCSLPPRVNKIVQPMSLKQMIFGLLFQTQQQD